MNLAYLERVDPARIMLRFYAIRIAPTLFGEWAVVREWGRIGSRGRERQSWFGSAGEAVAAAGAAGERTAGLSKTMLRRVSLLEASCTLPFSAIRSCGPGRVAHDSLSHGSIARSSRLSRRSLRSVRRSSMASAV
jgi:predicted DNA-binding WGR domain protein